MRRSWIAIGAGTLLLAGLAMALRDGAPALPGVGARPEPDAPVTRAELDELRAALEFERHARQALAEEVSGLRGVLQSVRPSVRRPAASPAGPPPAAEAETVAAGEGPEAPGGGASPADEGEARFDAEALVRAGLSDADAERLRARWEAHELEKLEINNLGLREGWKGRRFHQEHRALEAALRRELGDEWDAYLYATGRENRVRVSNVLADSLASRVGFEEGDMILSYDRQRVYQPNELQGGSAACPAGAFVGVEVMRDGRLETLRAPCGPLGVLVDHVKQPPVVP